jgi:hypothetical protein
MISNAYAQTLAPVSSGFTTPEILIGFAVVGVILVIVAFKEGWLTPATQATILTDIANLEAKIKAAAISLEQKFGTKTTPVTPVVPIVPAAAAAPPSVPSLPPTKAQRIADNQALLTAGTITQADFDAAKLAILAGP